MRYSFFHVGIILSFIYKQKLLNIPYYLLCLCKTHLYVLVVYCMPNKNDLTCDIIIHVKPPSFVRSLPHFDNGEKLHRGDKNLRRLAVPVIKKLYAIFVLKPIIFHNRFLHERNESAKEKKKCITVLMRSSIQRTLKSLFLKYIMLT